MTLVSYLVRFFVLACGIVSDVQVCVEPASRPSITEAA